MHRKAGNKPWLTNENYLIFIINASSPLFYFFLAANRFFRLVECHNNRNGHVEMSKIEENLELKTLSASGVEVHYYEKTSV